MSQDTKEIIQFKNFDHEQVAEKQQAALRAKFEEYLAKKKATYKKRATLHGALVEKSSRNVCRVSRSTKLKLRPSLTLKRRNKNQVQTAKNSPEAQQHRPATASKEVAEM